MFIVTVLVSLTSNDITSKTGLKQKYNYTIKASPTTCTVSLVPLRPPQVVLQEGQTSSEGQHIAEELMSKLGVAEQDLVSGAYMDLILQN